MDTPSPAQPSSPPRRISPLLIAAVLLISVVTLVGNLFFGGDPVRELRKETEALEREEVELQRQIRAAADKAEAEGRTDEAKALRAKLDAAQDESR